MIEELPQIENDSTQEVEKTLNLVEGDVRSVTELGSPVEQEFQQISQRFSSYKEEFDSTLDSYSPEKILHLQQMYLTVFSKLDNPEIPSDPIELLKLSSGKQLTESQLQEIEDFSNKYQIENSRKKKIFEKKVDFESKKKALEEERCNFVYNFALNNYEVLRGPQYSWTQCLSDDNIYAEALSDMSKKYKIANYREALIKSFHQEGKNSGLFRNSLAYSKEFNKLLSPLNLKDLVETRFKKLEPQEIYIPSHSSKIKEYEPLREFNRRYVLIKKKYQDIWPGIKIEGGIPEYQDYSGASSEVLSEMYYHGTTSRDLKSIIQDGSLSNLYYRLQRDGEVSRGGNTMVKTHEGDITAQKNKNHVFGMKDYVSELSAISMTGSPDPRYWVHSQSGIAVSLDTLISKECQIGNGDGIQIFPKEYNLGSDKPLELSIKDLVIMAPKKFWTEEITSQLKEHIGENFPEWFKEHCVMIENNLDQQVKNIDETFGSQGDYSMIHSGYGEVYNARIEAPPSTSLKHSRIMCGPLVKITKEA